VNQARFLQIFHRFFVDFDALRTLEIIEKPLKNVGFFMIFVFSAKPLPNQKNMAMRHADTLEMEAWFAQNNLPGHQNDSLRVQDEAQERQDGP